MPSRPLVMMLAAAVGGSDLLDIAKPKLNAVALSELHHEFRLERAFKVHVQLGLRTT